MFFKKKIKINRNLSVILYYDRKIELKTLNYLIMKIQTVLILTIALCLNFTGNAQTVSSAVNLIVTDTEGNVSAGDKIIFKNEKDGSLLSVVSDENGQASVRLNNGTRYQIKINSFEQASNYTAVDMADVDYEMQGLTLTIRYSLPKTYTLKNVNFESGSAVLTKSSYASLNNLAELLILKKSLKAELAGYTDNVGADDANLRLSQRRAEAVRTYLIKHGADSTRLFAKGYGEQNPVATNDTPAGRRKNRRTEIHILD